MGTTTLITTISDPAWFYSSLAQTSAAIVGLMGAVLTTRVVDHLSQIRSERGKLTEHIYAHSSSNNAQKETLKALEIYFENEINEDRRCIKENKQQRTRSHNMDFGVSSTGLGSVAVVDDLKKMEKSLSDAHKLSETFRILSGYVDVNELDLYVLSLVKVSEEVVLGRASEIPKSHAHNLASLSKEILRFQYKLVPTSFVVLTSILLILSIFGVIWPLSVLPGLPESATSRNWMLLGFAAGLFGLFTYLVYTFIEMRSYGKLLWQRLSGSIYE